MITAQLVATHIIYLNCCLLIDSDAALHDLTNMNMEATNFLNCINNAYCPGSGVQYPLVALLPA